MRFVSSGANVGNKIIVIRDNGSTHSPGYPSNGVSLIGAASSYPTKSKISSFAPSSAGHAFGAGSPNVPVSKLLISLFSFRFFVQLRISVLKPQRLRIL
jgi:hypothetical protein